MEVCRPGIKSPPQLQQHWILNPLPWAWDRTHTSTAPRATMVRSLTRCTTVGTPLWQSILKIHWLNDRIILTMKGWKKLLGKEGSIFHRCIVYIGKTLLNYILKMCVLFWFRVLKILVANVKEFKSQDRLVYTLEYHDHFVNILTCETYSKKIQM